MHLALALVSECYAQTIWNPAKRSLGGLEVLFLFAKSWDIPTALATFRRLARQCFTASLNGKLSSLARFGSYIRCLLRDSLYKAEILEEILKDCFGNHLRMFDYPETGISQCKLAVTATTTSTASTRLLTSYNGSILEKSKRGIARRRGYCLLPNMLTPIQDTASFDQTNQSLNLSFGKRM